MLLAKRRSLIGDLSGMAGEAAAGGGERKGDSPDLGTEVYRQELTAGLMANERALLAEIDEALARIQRGTFGYCLLAGEPISKARLEARPWAKHCIRCARLAEKSRTMIPGRLAADAADEDSSADGQDEESTEN